MFLEYLGEISSASSVKKERKGNKILVVCLFQLKPINSSYCFIRNMPLEFWLAVFYSKIYGKFKRKNI